MGTKPNKKPQLWEIASTEAKIKVEGQFPLEELNMGSIGGTYADITTVNQSHPITQWIRGNLENMTFETRLYAATVDTTKANNLTEKWENLQKLARRDSRLRRAPVCTFKMGPSILMDCFVESLSNIRIGYLRNDGTIKDVQLTITLRKYVASINRPTDPSAPENLSRTRYVKTGDTYESIAADEYGQAIFGELLRRFHRYRPDLTEGDTVHILPINYVLRNKKIRPQSAALADTDEANARKLELFDDRADSLTVIGT